jgi:hypothetical protein
METFTLDPLPFSVDMAWLADKLHVRPGSDLAGELVEVVARAQVVARPKAVYRLGFIEERGPDWVEVDGVRLTSRVLSVNLNDVQRVFVYVCTAGHELEQWGWAQPDILHQYYATIISEAVLYSARQAFGVHLHERYAVEHVSEMNPGSLRDWPLKEQRVLFDLLGDTRALAGVELTDVYLMRPAKTVSGLLFTTQDSYVNCRLCPRDICPNRRAEYDPALYESKYRQATDENG